MLNFQIEMLEAYLLVFSRVSGMMLLNPVLSRKNIPTPFKLGLILCLTLLFTPLADLSGVVQRGGDFGMIIALFQEFTVGVFFTLAFTFFYYMMLFAGDIMDFHFGMSMSKVFDPASNIQMSVSGSIFTYIYILYFFVYDCHLLLIRIINDSFGILPLGTFAFGVDAVNYGLDMFLSIFSIIVKLVIPFVALEFIIEMAMGILMKLIPQIHIFVINIQLKILLAFILLLIFAQPISDFMTKYLSATFDAAEKMLEIMTSG